MIITGAQMVAQSTATVKITMAARAKDLVRLGVVDFDVARIFVDIDGYVAISARHLWHRTHEFLVTGFLVIFQLENRPETAPTLRADVQLLGRVRSSLVIL